MPPLADRVPSRVIIEGVSPEVDAGRFAAKRTVGEEMSVEADIHTDGHEVLAAVLCYRHQSTPDWIEVSMAARPNDRWIAKFHVNKPGFYEYTLQAWIDRFATWHRDLGKRVEAAPGRDQRSARRREMVRQTAGRVGSPDGNWLRGQAELLSFGDMATRTKAALDTALLAVMARHADRGYGYTYPRTPRIWVDREKARFGNWYELFPRSCSDEHGRHGTFRDVEKRLDYIAGMGFDVLYLPPIHPIGQAYRKGPNNTLTPGPNDPGSPWAIGGRDGGHKAVHLQLGLIGDFDHLLASAASKGIEIAMDIAFQCSPDHPYVKEHPQWFRHRPDGTIKYAENPRRNTKTSIRSISNATIGAICGRSCSASSCSGRIAAYASSASIIRTPSRFASGNG
ncbi:MAG: maltotransferase domain-containing protein [Gemmataceae bacterium]